MWSPSRSPPPPSTHVPPWQESGTEQAIRLPVSQRPPAHVSLCVHAPPSLHRVPSIAALCRQVRETGSQLAIVQGSPSLQSECVLHPSAGDALRRSNETANAKS